MQFIIPSYKRATYLTTPQMLVNTYGVDPSKITLCLQEESERDEYINGGRVPAGVNILVNPEAHNAASNRNSGIMNHLGELIVLMDDDIRKFMARNTFNEPEPHVPEPHHGTGVRASNLSASGFRRMLHDWLCVLENSGYDNIVSLNVNGNTGYLSYPTYTGRFRSDAIVVGQVIMMVASEDRLLDDSIDYGDDMELGLRLVHNGHHTIRDTAFSIRANNRIASSKTEIPGGVIEVLDKKDECLTALASTYPDLVSFKPGMNIPRIRNKVMGTYVADNSDVYKPLDENDFIKKVSKRND